MKMKDIVKKNKEVFNVSMIVVIILWISAIIIRMLNYANDITGIFIWVFSLVILAYIGNCKNADKENEEIKISEYIVAIGIVTSMAYIVCIGFIFGRYVFRSI